MKSPLVLPESYWIASTEATTYPAAEGPVTTDVAVVGGGIAGLCTAWELARAGRSVTVLEADRIAAAVTGNTTAKLSAQHAAVYAHLRDGFGSAAARDYAEAQTSAITRVAEIAAELGIDCDLERAPSYVYTETEDGVAALRDEADAAREAGLPASFTTETGLPYPVAGAVRVEDQAQFHPRRFLLALAADLTAQGGRIFEQSRVTGLDDSKSRDGGHVLALAGGGEVRCEQVVIATQFPVIDRVKLFARLTPRRELVVAGAIPEAADPGGMYLTTEHATRSVRTAPYGDGRRLLIVTGEAFTPGDAGTAERLERLTAWATDRFGLESVEYRWAAQDYTTTDRVPFVGEVSGEDGVYVACGFGGWGMSNGVAAARTIAETMAGEPPRWAGLFGPGRFHLLREGGKLAAAQSKVVKHFIGDRLPHAAPSEPEDLAPGQGAVMRIEGALRAVYRDEDGGLHTLSATCTHLGCVVGFNDAERNWECPCHGSRFATSGAVLQGPAAAPLEAHPHH
ncbi:FAD-dependent oxidoreductase [Glycomyces algeriensis]|uniref:Iron-sulfur-binding protein n=1 Tax=Glycomyces algeriensis TaxID=256037 RepID=A0A9W6LGV6_9ACTN|nr:FAD-dependent oxidoreductase [Glycomyces algeriensis]MDA1365049.1 FAD-dependent oxidoreductase [Glycomyces algeriensis]MDR7349889.1 glycine/D-amino acid oxidase-like deaminating enzyme/nitrite reductase/ring-hydroxylating ferredoxin subunit [Glycomyces algeriensis]GLI42600.1 iron-sulfur-binding protein [Glycomyces algeriensis]